MQQPQMQNTSVPMPPEIKEEDQPWYLKYGLRGLGTVAGGLAMLLGTLNLIFSIFSPTCILFSIWQILLGFVVVTVESPCCCVFVEHVNMITSKIEAKPLWMKAAVYCAGPLPSIIFCIGFYTIIGGGLIIATGVAYGMTSLGKKAPRHEMAYNAQRDEYFRNTSIPQEQEPQYPPSKTPSVHGSTTVKKESPPPSYTDLQAPKSNLGWDTSYLSASNASLSAQQQPSDKPVPSNPFNPFQ